MSVKKSVRITDQNAEVITTVCKDNASAGINSIIEQYAIYSDECLPELSENEKNALFCAHNVFASRGLDEDIRTLHFNVSEGYEYDEQVRDLLANDETAVAFIQRIKAMTRPEKLAIIHMIRQFWNARQSTDESEE